MLMLLTAKRPHPPSPPFRVMDGWMDGRTLLHLDSFWELTVLGKVAKKA